MSVEFGKIFSLVSKYGGLAVAAFGVNTNNLKEMTVGGVYAAIIHLWDSVFNSPRGQHPSV